MFSTPTLEVFIEPWEAPIRHKYYLYVQSLLDPLAEALTGFKRFSHHHFTYDPEIILFSNDPHFAYLWGCNRTRFGEDDPANLFPNGRTHNVILNSENLFSKLKITSFFHTLVLVILLANMRPRTALRNLI